MFQPVSSQPNFAAQLAEQERNVLAFWARTRAFERLRDKLAGANRQYSFLDGPITANNPMGVHHAWGRTYKDLWQRYHAMIGCTQRWQNGFDCQGLWVEVNVEKDLGYTSKRDIEARGVQRFINLCKQRVLNSAALQTEQSIRLGYWMDWDDPAELRMLAERIVQDPAQAISLRRNGREIRGTVEQLVGQLGSPELGRSYFTFSDENNYQIWGMLKKCYERGWIYKGSDVIPWCPRCATGISQHEMDTEGYKDRADKAIVARLKVRRFNAAEAVWQSEDARRKFEASEEKYLLVWTTTPWTLPANVMAAVGPKLTYVIAQQSDGAVYVLGAQTLKTLKGDYEILGELHGAALIGWRYEGLFDDLPAWRQAAEQWQQRHDGQGAFEHQVIPWDEVSEAEGTGIVHIAPGAGPEDFQLGKQFDSPSLAPLDEDGVYLDGFGPLTGRFAHDVPELVIELLREKGYFYRADTYLHRYPHCWRDGTPLVYRLVDEWYISMDELRHEMIEVAKQIRWIPDFGLERELDWLRNMRDWMISKKRYWGLALPIWEYPDGTFEVIGSKEELRARAVEGWEEFEGHTPHRPHIDKVKIRHPKTGLIGTRIPDVGNPWLDAGIVAYSTLRYGSDPDYWRKWFPADFITESFPGQFRNWFYSLIAMSTVLENKPPTRTVLGFATLLDAKGKPMHKSSGNMIEFNEAADRAGADVMRWLYCRQAYDDNLLFGWEALDEVRRTVFIPLWNVYAFFVNYANIDGWTPDRMTEAADVSYSALDRWILARLNQVIGQTRAALDDYNARTATLAIEKFVDDLSNWYVRRSRRRFWRNETDAAGRADKQAAYATLYHVLTTLCRLMAPFIPFFSEALWQNLAHQRTVAQADASAESVHHQPYPVAADLSAEDIQLLRDTAIARTMVNLGHSTRAQSGFKVRQPLARAMVVADATAQAAIRAQEDVIADELNVKQIEFVARESELVHYKILPDNKKLGPQFGALFPQIRKALSELDAGQVAATVKAGRPVELRIGDQFIALQPDDILVQAVPREGLVVAGEDGIVVALDTTLTEELAREGLAREVVRRVNELRKSAGLNLTDRIIATYTATPRLAAAMKDFEWYIRNETLAVELREVAAPAEVAGQQISDTFDSESLTIGIARQ
ncbi:MAG: class I tRNA ligase family protein [Anaerolineae bacterium]|nr:class I tRNA ligase family protein [Thermoflexales bacterium]MDW8407016.1 class I tRNA ligase family protein [Anaerolineae bacterium]